MSLLGYIGSFFGYIEPKIYDLSIELKHAEGNNFIRIKTYSEELVRRYLSMFRKAAQNLQDGIVVINIVKFNDNKLFEELFDIIRNCRQRNIIISINSCRG